MIPDHSHLREPGSLLEDRGCGEHIFRRQDQRGDGLNVPVEIDGPDAANSERQLCSSAE